MDYAFQKKVPSFLLENDALPGPVSQIWKVGTAVRSAPRILSL